jgi:hypothetical protein
MVKHIHILLHGYVTLKFQVFDKKKEGEWLYLLVSFFIHFCKLYVFLKDAQLWINFF